MNNNIDLLQKKSKLKFIASLLLIILILFFIISEVYQLINRSQIENLFSSSEPFGVLVISNKQTDKIKETGFIGVAIIYPKTSRIGIVSLLPQVKLQASLPPLQELIRKEKYSNIVSSLSKMLNIDIPAYISIPLKSIEKAVDMIEGLPWFNYQPFSLLNEKLPAGEQLLDGSKIKSLLYPKQNKSIVQVVQSYRFFSLFLNYWSKREIFSKRIEDKKTFNIITNEIKANFDFSGLANIISNLSSDKNWLPIFMELPIKKIKDIMLPHPDAANLYLKSFKKKLESKNNPFGKSLPKIEIKNGTTIAGLAKKFRRKLNKKGLQVLEFSNADHKNYEKSILIDCNSNVFYLNRVAKILKIKKKYHLVNRALFTDLILILGKDYKTLMD